MGGGATRWQYRVEVERGSLGPRDLDALGAEGWELVSVRPAAGDADAMQWVFKRPVPGALAGQIETKTRGVQHDG